MGDELDDRAEAGEGCAATPEQRLAAAVVGRYALDLLRPAGDGGEALADLHGDGVILARLCDFAGLDYTATREALMRLKSEQDGKTAKQLIG